MQTTIVAKGKTTISKTMQLLIERRLRYAFGRFEESLKAVRVTLEDVNGPKGGLDKRCTIQVDARGIERIVVEERDGKFPVAITNAAERAHRAVSKVLAKLHDRRTENTGARVTKRKATSGL